MFRNIIEMTHMRNNDEHVMYTPKELDGATQFKGRRFDTPHLVISRQVYPEEVATGLDTSWEGPIHDTPNAPELTGFLDDFYKLRKEIERGLKLGLSLTSILNSAIAYTFYDCMSAGAGPCFLSACRWFLEHHDIDLNTEVYPSGPNGWHTMTDFLREIEDVPRLEEMLAQLPCASKLLVEVSTCES